MPVHNGETTIGKAIDSILAQSFSDFELIIGDDGSTDNTRSIVAGYNDQRITLLSLDHDFISTLNTLLDTSRGKYIARIDADDIMLPERLKMQAEYMEAHPEIAATGGMTSNIEHHEWYLKGGEVTLSMLCEGNWIINPTSMIRRSALDTSGIRYEKDYVYAEDYRLWSQLAKKGYRLVNLPEKFVSYGLSANQVSRKKHIEQTETAEKIKKQNIREIMDRANHGYIDPIIENSGNKLTVIVTFLNEGQEAVNTIRSVREVFGENVDIIALNDASYDGYDYQSALKRYNVYYILNSSRLGVAASRDKAIDLITTPYFLLLDGHMRVYDKDTPKAITEILEQNDRRLLCCQTLPLEPDPETGQLKRRENYNKCFGAYSTTTKGKYLPDIDWINNELYPDQETEPIPMILGAGYAASKRYWQYLGGLKGLKCWGSDETFISYKAWMEGGECILLKHHTTGHLYRDHSPYFTLNSEVAYNCLFISELLFDDTMLNRSHAAAMSHDFATYQKSVSLLEQNNNALKEAKTLIEHISTRSFNEVLEIHEKLTAGRIEDRKSIKSDISDNLATVWEICHQSCDGNLETPDWKALEKTDRIIASKDISRLPIKQYADGAGEFLAYLTARLQIADIDNTPETSLLTVDTLLTARELALRVLSTPQCDRATYFHAREYLFSINNPDGYIWRQEISDIARA